MERLRQRLGGRLPVDAIAVTGQMHAAVLADAGGRAVRPALLWLDRRAGAEVSEVARAWGSRDAAAVTGSPPGAELILPKLLWLRRHEPAALGAAHRVLAVKDWVRWSLGGTPVAEPTDASGTGMLDLRTLAWDAALLEALGLPSALLPALAPSAAVDGELSPGWAARLGLRAGTPLAAGAGDLPAAVLGSGAGPGQPVINLGSAAQVAVVGRPGAMPRAAQLFCHPDPGLRIALGALLAAGLALGWARQVLGNVEPAPPSEVAPLLFVPHLAGERGPAAGLRSRGAFIGLALETTAREMAGAAAYGVAMACRERLEDLAAGGGVPLVLAEEPGARDWAERLAGVLGRPVSLAQGGSPSARGAALLAGLAVGALNWDALPPVAAVQVCSRPEAAAQLAALYAAYLRARPAVAAASEALTAGRP